MNHFRLCLANYYSIELLESTDKGFPTSKEIQYLESLLLNSKINYHHPDLAQFIQYDFPEKNALLIEKDPLFQKAHYILLSNMGFKVSVASSKEEIFCLPEKSYDAVFSHVSSEDFMLDTSGSLYLYVTPEEKEKTNNSFQQGAKAVLELPLNLHALYEVLK